MSYRAIDIARSLVIRFRDAGNPVTNIKLQKVLYFTWMEYYYKFKTYLFKEEFLAWRWGPISREPYFEFRINIADPIKHSDQPDCTIDKNTSEFLDWIVKEYGDVPASFLIDATHREGGPWHKVYEEDKTNIPIPFRFMEEECERIRKTRSS